MPPSPTSPDKTLVSNGNDSSDNTGWMLALMKEQKDLVLSIIEANDTRYSQRFEASKEAISSALNAAKEAIAAALTSQDRAVQKAEAASEKRFESVNEFRSTLADQQRTLMPRQEAEIMFRGFTDKITALELRMTETTGSRMGIGQGWGYAAGAVGLVLAVAAFAMRWMP